jgi:nucleoside-diphosphate-sugar epimerase
MAAEGLTVAVTGPTGDLGVAIVSALERSRAVKRVVGMARRPFDPGALGWRKTEYRQGDVTDRASVRDLVKGADAVVHLAFAILTASDATRRLNVDGSRLVFEESVQAEVPRLCYASSVAAYGFHRSNPAWLTEDVPTRGSGLHAYSAQKAEVEHVLADVLDGHPSTAAWVFRPCIVAGPRARTMLEEIPYQRLSEALPDPLGRMLGSLPGVKPVIPDPGLRFQLVHEDDVANAFLAGVRGRGEPGAYNLAAAGTLTLGDLADSLGWYSLRVPKAAIAATAEAVARLPLLPEQTSWVEAIRTPVLMKSTRARKALGWRPRHTARATLDEMVAAQRAAT